MRHGKELADRLTYLHLNPARKCPVAKPEDWPCSSYNNFALDHTIVVRFPIQIDDV